MAKHPHGYAKYKGQSPLIQLSSVIHSNRQTFILLSVFTFVKHIQALVTYFHPQIYTPLPNCNNRTDPHWPFLSYNEIVEIGPPQKLISLQKEMKL